MPKGLYIANRTDLVLFDSAWIAGVDYDEELFDDTDHQPNENENKEEDSDEILEEYDGMEVNDLAKIMDEPHGFHVPDETNGNEETVVEQNNDEDVDDDNDDKDYEDSDADDESLAANQEEEEVNRLDALGFRASARSSSALVADDAARVVNGFVVGAWWKCW
jgi:hypothetical protein